MQTLDPDGTKLLIQVVEWLVVGDFNAVAATSGHSRLTAAQIEEAIRSYGRTLVIPPSDALEDLDVVRVMGASEPTWSVRFDLWTLEDGRSDLSLECTICRRLQSAGATIEIDGIHVL